MIEAHERVLIVCSGPSVTALQAAELTARAAKCGAFIIAVNGALRYVTAHAWFTLDPSAENRVMMQRPTQGVTYFAAFPRLYAYPIPRHVIRLKRIEGSGPLKAMQGLSDDPAAVHTGNSGYGALGLAYHARAQKIAFLGLDGSKHGYFYGGPGPRGTLEHLPALFQSALPQLNAAGVKVMNGSMQSTVSCFDRMRPEDTISWLSAF